MSMMREIMEKSYMCSDELYYIAEESVEESGVLEKEEVVDDGREKRLEEDP